MHFFIWSPATIYVFCHLSQATFYTVAFLCGMNPRNSTVSSDFQLDIREWLGPMWGQHMPAAHTPPLPLLSNSVFSSLHSGAMCSGHPFSWGRACPERLGLARRPHNAKCTSVSELCPSGSAFVAGLPWYPTHMQPHIYVHSHAPAYMHTHLCTTTPLHRHTQLLIHTQPRTYIHPQPHTCTCAQPLNAQPCVHTRIYIHTHSGLSLSGL